MQLETERLLLREFVESDWPAVLAYQANPLYLQYYHWPARQEEDVRAFVAMFLKFQAERPRRKFQLAVTLKQGGRLIGSCGVRVNDPDLREANIGYEIDPQFWGMGYATEAARRILKFGFVNLEMHRIWATTLLINAGSIRVLEKLGLRREGHEREKEFIKGLWRDSLTYAILNHEYQA